MSWDEALVQAAVTALTDAGDGEFHTVGAAVRDADGAIYTGVNMFHFSGGPCAEMTALANAAGTRAVRIVAVGDAGRGILAPCGRCRQIMLDLVPDIEVMLPGGNVSGVATLLPTAYHWSDGR